MDSLTEAPALAGAGRPSTAGGEPDALIEVNHLDVGFRIPGGLTPVVRDVSFSIHRGKTIVLVGESGSGKSVTARAILGLNPMSAVVAGSVRYAGQELVGLSEKEWRKLRGSHVGIVFQDPQRSLNPTMRIGIQVSEGVRRRYGLSHAEASKRAVELLDLVGIPFPQERIRDYPHQLSGGMRQRVMLAIAISSQPKVLIADEPTTALDVTIQAQIMELLRRLQAEFDLGVLLITHDMGLAFSYGDEVAVMYAGKIVEQAPAREMQTFVRMPYARGLLDSVPRLGDAPHSAFHALPGRPPDPGAFPPGCAFAPRCAYRQERCDDEQPPFEGEDNHRFACWYPL